MAPGRHNRSTSGSGARYARSLRVNQVLRQVVAEEIERLADADERLRLVTVTAVDCSPDLRQATVYLSSISDDAAEALEERRLALQSCVGREGRVKRTPRLSFTADPAIVTGEAVESVLRRLVTERPSEAEGAESEEP